MRYLVFVKTAATFDVIATNSTSMVLSTTGFGLVVIPLSTGSTCRVDLFCKALYVLTMLE